VDPRTETALEEATENTDSGMMRKISLREIALAKMMLQESESVLNCSLALLESPSRKIKLLTSTSRRAIPLVMPSHR